MSAITTGEFVALEALIDKLGVSEVLRQVALICYEKADHLQVNWQDRQSAAAWSRCAVRIEATASKVES